MLVYNVKVKKFVFQHNLDILLMKILYHRNVQNTVKFVEVQPKINVLKRIIFTICQLVINFVDKIALPATQNSQNIAYNVNKDFI